MIRYGDVVFDNSFRILCSPCIIFDNNITEILYHVSTLIVEKTSNGKKQKVELCISAHGVISIAVSQGKEIRTSKMQSIIVKFVGVKIDMPAPPARSSWQFSITPGIQPKFRNVIPWIHTLSTVGWSWKTCPAVNNTPISPFCIVQLFASFPSGPQRIFTLDCYSC